MENLDIGNIVFGALVVQAFNLVIILLAKTENILKAVERIKGVVGLDYRNRAKRSDNEVRISKKHAQVAKERVRHSFVTMNKWGCKWVWNWSENLEPINVKGYCLGNSYDYAFLNQKGFYKCSHPVYAGFLQTKEEEEGTKILSNVGIFCRNEVTAYHNRLRANFQVYYEDTKGQFADDMVLPIISKSILSERDLLIAKEIIKLRRQFWR